MLLAVSHESKNWALALLGACGIIEHRETSPSNAVDAKEVVRKLGIFPGEQVSGASDVLLAWEDLATRTRSWKTS